jgi:hypothetical protein
MKLTPEQIETIKKRLIAIPRGDLQMLDSADIYLIRQEVLSLFNHIEALEAENKELKLCPNESWECDREQRRLLKERDQLKERVARLRECIFIEKAFHEEMDCPACHLLAWDEEMAK